jgi:hypothetical protein
MVSEGFCPNDVIGSAIGCYSFESCNQAGWSTNDCFCRLDLQAPAQAHVTSCIKRSCTVGNFALDASTAGSIYSQYCRDKGYVTPTYAATVAAPTTGLGRATATGAFGAGPTGATSPGDVGDTSTPPSSTSNRMSISTIIGIVAGSVAGLVFLLVAIKMIYSFFSRRRAQRFNYANQAPPSYHPPIYPMEPFPEQNWSSIPKSEVTPGDSVSMISTSVPRPMPSLASAAPGYGRY